ncbi:MAG TPA: 2-oxo-4-hydroxy-4-carboxy-5-ureidoimidazoline decarboxylase, partial [Thermomicrobiales bacterium]|nr:2-oxo-4-hydroxy-4-carboxy-5-ureidoimidazoline decarboxylase [Thermomicrobiales bacterium]
MTGPLLSIDQVNALPRPVFVAAFGGVFEHSPWVAEGAWERRPWRSLPELHAAMCATVREAGVERQLALIRSHPDLVGRAALAGTLTRASSAEQAAAGLDPGRLAPDEVARFAEANAAYQARFGFPFVVCARENAKEAILAGMADRLGNAPEAEIATALGEIEKIAWYRLADLVAAEPAAPRSLDQRKTASRPEPAVPSAYTYEIGYGKKGVPVYRTHARPLTGVAPIPESPFVDRANHLVAAEIDTEVYGEEFLPAYTHGDNAMVVATDSMKNFVIRETLAFEGATLEGLCFSLAVRFAETYPQLRSLRITGRELPFAGVPIPRGPGFAPGDNLFEHRRGDLGEATVRVEV